MLLSVDISKCFGVNGRVPLGQQPLERLLSEEQEQNGSQEGIEVKPRRYRQFAAGRRLADTHASLSFGRPDAGKIAQG